MIFPPLFPLILSDTAFIYGHFGGFIDVGLVGAEE